MLLLTALLIICFEAIGEGLIKRYSPSISAILFKLWLQWVIAIGLFAVWFWLMQGFDKYYVPNWKLIAGFVFVRFLIFDFIYNIISGLPLMFYGTTKLYDRIMKQLGGYGLMLKVIAGIMGIVFLLGID
jgi:hypothetical protein